MIYIICIGSNFRINFLTKNNLKTNLLVALHLHILAVVCQAGFTGKYCDEQCKFPNYGYGCQQQCLCPKIRCSTGNGCQKIKPGVFLNLNTFN